MRNCVPGQIAAAVYVGPRPHRGLADFQADGRFHLVGIPYGPELADYFPAQVNARDYPNLTRVRSGSNRLGGHGSSSPKLA